MYCPKCRMEYREGFIKCSDCGVPLVTEKPPEPTVPGEPDLELVTVLESIDRLVIALAKGVLEEAEISFHVLGDEIGGRPGMADPLIHRLCQVQVARDRETEALEILRPLDERQG